MHGRVSSLNPGHSPKDDAELAGPSLSESPSQTVPKSRSQMCRPLQKGVSKTYNTTMAFPWGINPVIASNTMPSRPITPRQQSTAISDPRRIRNLRTNVYKIASMETDSNDVSIFDQSDDFVLTGLEFGDIYSRFATFVSRMISPVDLEDSVSQSPLVNALLPIDSPPPIPLLPEPIHRNFPM